LIKGDSFTINLKMYLTSSQISALTNNVSIKPLGGSTSPSGYHNTSTSNTNSVVANNPFWPLGNDSTSLFPTPMFKMEFYKAHNGGFIMRLIKDGKKSENASLYILKDLDNIGNEIQNIMMLEVIKND
jgi:hypothetical protein